MEAIDRLLAGLDGRMRQLSAPATAEVRAVRRSISRELRAAEPTAVLALAARLVERDGPFDRFLAYEIVASHPPRPDGHQGTVVGTP